MCGARVCRPHLLVVYSFTCACANVNYGFFIIAPAYRVTVVLLYFLGVSDEFPAVLFLPPAFLPDDNPASWSLIRAMSVSMRSPCVPEPSRPEEARAPGGDSEAASEALAEAGEEWAG